jgi:hypothetical protein
LALAQVRTPEVPVVGRLGHDSPSARIDSARSGTPRAARLRSFHDCLPGGMGRWASTSYWTGPGGVFTRSGRPCRTPSGPGSRETRLPPV